MRKQTLFQRNKLTLCALTCTLAYLITAFCCEIYSRSFSTTNQEKPVYEKADFEERYQPPSSKHFFGTDYLGRDVFWRSIHATKSAVKVGLIATLLSVTIGVFLGLLSGYFGGYLDDFIVWLYSSFAAIPSLLFILSFALLISKDFLYAPIQDFFDTTAGFLGTSRSMLAIYLGIGMTGWVSICRIVRSETMKLRDQQYITAAYSLGYSPQRIILKHIFPNLAHLVIIYATMRFSYAIMTEVIVSYLGLGIQLEPSWGTMIADGQQKIWRGIWWEVGGATFFMFFLILSLNILGDGLRDLLDPKLKERH